MADRPAGGEIVVGLTLPRLPGALPEPRLGCVAELLRLQQNALVGHRDQDGITLCEPGGLAHGCRDRQRALLPQGGVASWLSLCHADFPTLEPPSMVVS